MAFIQSGQSWQFSTESDLEEVVWRHLPQLLNLQPLSRQFSISGKFCDILAVDDANQLVIVELKNTEDRYVVQQLVRYYDAIKTAEALPFNVAMSESRLIAMAMPAESDRAQLPCWCAHRLPILHAEDRVDDLQPKGIS